ncbi:hypothetical protein UT300005_29340 [Clostridium sp. CTA-5]
MSDKEVNLVNSELLAKFTDAVSHKIGEHTGLLFFECALTITKVAF